MSATTIKRNAFGMKINTNCFEIGSIENGRQVKIDVGHCMEKAYQGKWNHIYLKVRYSRQHTFY